VVGVVSSLNISNQSVSKKSSQEGVTGTPSWLGYFSIWTLVRKITSFHFPENIFMLFRVRVEIRVSGNTFLVKLPFGQ